MKWVLCQTKSTLGNFEKNRKTIQSLMKQYKDADLLIFPEMHLMGYPPEDLLEQSHFIKKQEKELQKIKCEKNDPAILFGACINNKKTFNSAVFKDNTKIQIFHKIFLALSDTFDEKRFFSPSENSCNILNFKNKKILILICEDLWKIQKFPKSIDAIICINASPFFPEQTKNRISYAQKIAKKIKAPLIYLNCVGAQDELIFDGSSFILNEKGEVSIQSSSFKEETICINPWNLKKQKIRKKVPDIQMKKEAIQLGVKEFILHSGFKKVHLGLSGGLDSALLACLLVDIFGPKKVTALFLEGPFNPKLSKNLSRDLSKELGIMWIEKPIISTYEHICRKHKKLSSVAKQNIQARLRSLFLMAYSNTHHSMLIGTNNKSELALGYATLYGDLSGALFPIGDLYKTEIQEITNIFYPSPTMNNILKRKPSAELLRNQFDEDDIPPYEVLDPILKNLIEKGTTPKTKLEKEILSRILKTEFKRKQSAIILKVSAKAFGRGRRYPIHVNYLP